MIDSYLKKIDDFILAADEIVDVEVVRRTVWDTDLEKIGIYRYKVYLSDGSLLELTERLVEGCLLAPGTRFLDYCPYYGKHL